MKCHKSKEISAKMLIRVLIIDQSLDRLKMANIVNLFFELLQRLTQDRPCAVFKGQGFMEVIPIDAVKCK